MLDHSNRKESPLHQRGTSRTATKPPVVSKLQKSGRNESYFRFSSDVSPNEVISGQKTAGQVTEFSGDGAGRLSEITPSNFYSGSPLELVLINQDSDCLDHDDATRIAAAPLA